MLPRGKSKPNVSRFSNCLRGHKVRFVGSYLLIFNILTTISVKILAEQNTFVVGLPLPVENLWPGKIDRNILCKAILINMTSLNLALDKYWTSLSSWLCWHVYKIQIVCVVGQLWCHMLSWLVNNNKKVTKALNRHFTKDIQIASKHSKRCSASLAIMEIEIKTTMR